MIINSEDGRSKDVFCDECGFSENRSGAWDRMILQLKYDGWRTAKVGDIWENYCPKCYRGYKIRELFEKLETKKEKNKRSILCMYKKIKGWMSEAGIKEEEEAW